MGKGLTFTQMVELAAITGGVTFLANSFFHYLKNKLDWFHDSKKFKRDFAMEQLKELYIPAYGVVSQSEFLRRFNNEEDKPYDEFPFFEIVKKQEKVVTDLTARTVKREVVKISDVITDFNKEKLASLIIDKGVFASQELLKLAVSYRYVSKHYEDETIEATKLQKFRSQELDLIHRIVQLIIRETNEKLKECGMPYSNNEIELSTMIIDYNENLSAKEEQ
jgi:hypothetical protein